MSKDISLIGYACGQGGNVLGCQEGPKVLRQLGLLEKIKELGIKTTDLGDALPSLEQTEKQALQNKIDSREQSINNILTVFKACSELSEKTKTALENDTMPLILGGDHSLSIGSVASISNFYKKQNKQIGLIWIDTHPDLNSPETSPSSNPFGMSTAVLLNHFPGLLSSIQEPAPAISPENLVYVGLRDVDPGEKKIIKESKINAFTIKDIDINGAYQITKNAIEIASKNTEGFVVSFDLDVCDPSLVPGICTPVRGGLSFRESHLILETIAESNKMLGFEIVELNPLLDKEHKTANLAIALVESALGKSIL